MIFFIGMVSRNVTYRNVTAYITKNKIVSCSPESCKICVISINFGQFSLQDMHLEKNSETK